MQTRWKGRQAPCRTWLQGAGRYDEFVTIRKKSGMMRRSLGNMRSPILRSAILIKFLRMLEKDQFHCTVGLRKVFLLKILLKGSGVVEDRYKTQRNRRKYSHWRCCECFPFYLRSWTTSFSGETDMLRLFKALSLTVKGADTQTCHTKTPVNPVML